MKNDEEISRDSDSELNEERHFYHVDEFREVVGGRIFSAVFTKKDGTERKIRARLGVTKGLKGGELSYNPSEHNNLIVWDMDKSAYRTIAFDRLKQIKYNGKEETFE